MTDTLSSLSDRDLLLLILQNQSELKANQQRLEKNVGKIVLDYRRISKEDRTAMAASFPGNSEGSGHTRKTVAIS